MRKVKTLSNSSINTWRQDRELFYLKYLAPTKLPRDPQVRAMAIGSAFDAYAKSELDRLLFGKGVHPEFEFDTIFTDQVEEQNRDWAREHGRYVFDCYVESRAFNKLLEMLEESRVDPRFEFTVTGEVMGVPVLGKPDCWFIHKGGTHVVLDWKVRGYCSRHPQSPSKFYALCRDGIGFDKPSRSHDKPHPKFEQLDMNGFKCHRGYFETSSKTYADQLSIYAWLMGEPVGDENFVGCIDELLCKAVDKAATQEEIDEQYHTIRVANLAARIGYEHQWELANDIKEIWRCIQSGHIFTDMTRTENDERLEVLNRMSENVAATHGIDEFKPMERQHVYRKV